MKQLWELARMPTDGRRRIQDNKIRKVLIGAYAPREPAVMDAILTFLKYEKRLPLSLVHKIVDRISSMAISTTVVTYDEVQDFIKGIPDDFRISKGPCACRLHTAEVMGPDARDLEQRRLDFCQSAPLNIDIQIGACGDEFGKLDTYELITKEELLELERQCHNMGLVANVYMIAGGDAGICHCSAPTCAPFLANEAIGSHTAVLKKGTLVARTDRERCQLSGDCTKVCHFGARKLVALDNGSLKLRVDPQKCYGCGYCAEVCGQRAITMFPRKRNMKLREWLKEAVLTAVE